jgi:hypothetical protein
MPCGFLDFEGDISSLGESQLAQMASEAPQASSNEPDQILDNLKKWRGLYLHASTRADRERIKNVCEAIRAKARLLFWVLNGQRMLQVQHTEQVSTRQQQEASHGKGCPHVC